MKPLTFKQWELGEITRSEFWGQFTNPVIYSWIQERILSNWIREDPDIYLGNTVSVLLDMVGMEEIVRQFREMVFPELWKEAAERELNLFDCLQIFIEGCYRLTLLQDVEELVLNGRGERTIEKVIRSYCEDSGYYSLLDQRRLESELAKLIERKSSGTV